MNFDIGAQSWQIMLLVTILYLAVGVLTREVWCIHDLPNYPYSHFRLENWKTCIIIFLWPLVWIGALMIALVFLCGMFLDWVFDRGYW